MSADGRSARLDNFTKSTIWTGRRSSSTRSRGRVDKGQTGLLAAFLEAVRTGEPMPVSLASLVTTTGATLASVRSLAAGAPEKV